MLIKRSLILLGLQASLGAAATLDPANDAILVQNLSCTPTNATMVERTVIKPTLGKEQSIYAGHLMQVTFTAELKGSGVEGKAPEIGQALQACGLVETVVADASVTYTPASTNLKLATMAFYEDGNLTKLKDVRGNAVVTIPASGTASVAFTLTGHMDGDVTAVAMPTASFAATLPAPIIGLSSLSVGGFAAELNQITLDLGNEVVTPKSIRSADGFGEIRIASRDPNGAIDPEDTVVTTKNWLKEWMDGTLSVIDTGVVGNVAGNRWKLLINAAAWRDVQPGEREQVRTKQISFGAAETSGDDQFSLVFT